MTDIVPTDYRGGSRQQSAAAVPLSLAHLDLTGSGLPDEVAALGNYLLEQLDFHNARTAVREDYYRAKQLVTQLGIAVPPQFGDLETVVGWPAMAVDVLEERLDVEGFAVPDANDVADEVNGLWGENRLDVEGSQGHLDALIAGVSFVAVTPGDVDAGEPDVLITVEPPTRVTGSYDRRTGQLTAAIIVSVTDPVFSEPVGAVTGVSVYLPDVTYRVELDAGRWVVVDVDEHNLGRVTIEPLINRPRSMRPWGASEITKPLMAYTDTAVRTVLGMEIAREFYSSPQRYILGADESAFQDADGNPKTAWEAYLGRWFAVGRATDEDGEEGSLPQVGQFSASSPAPYLEQLRGLAQMVGAEAAMPAHYLGFVTDNPASADAIRAEEARLVKRAERRQRSFGVRWANVMRKAMLVRYGTIPDDLARLSTLWVDAGTPTKAAAADAVVKLVSVGILPAQSDVTFELLGISDTDRARLAADVRRERAASMLATFAPAATPTPAPTPPATPTPAVPANVGG